MKNLAPKRPQLRFLSLKFLSLRPWQYLALISGVIVALAMGLASVSYSATLGTNESAFPLLLVTNAQLFAGLALAFELAMISSVFGFWHWRGQSLLAAIFCLALFAISSTYSVHAVHGYIALNVTKTENQDARFRDISGSFKRELDEAQAHLSALNTLRLKARGRRGLALASEINAQRRLIEVTRSRLARTATGIHVSPVAGLEWFLALSLWVFNAICWTAWFGTGPHASAPVNHELRARAGAQQAGMETCSASTWLATYMTGHKQGEPEHCAQLYEHYIAWCADMQVRPLADRKFYTRLVELGARKFRDGRNGPMKYVLPQSPVANGKLEA